MSHGNEGSSSSAPRFLSRALATWLLCSCASTQPTHTPDPAVNRLALLIGIGTYPGDQPHDLPGPANDITLVGQLLRERFAFPAANIVTLRDDQATHAAIVDTFRSFLLAHSKPDTDVVFWYCGHGSRIVDRSEREADGLDNSLVAHDSRSRKADGSYDVSDDELHTLLQQLAAITDRIVVVTDACYSESSFRGDAEPRERTVVRFTDQGTAALDMELVAPLWKEHAILEDGAPERRAIEDRFVHVAACARWQMAAEREFDGRAHGLLTWHLVRALERARPGDTWRRVFEQAQLMVQEARPGQVPTFDGSVDREVFGGRFVAPPLGIPARLAPLGAGHELVIEAGALTGLVVGSTLRLHPLYGEAALGGATVVQLQRDGLHAFAKWTAPAPTVERGQPLRAVEIARPARAPRMSVAAARAGLVAELGLGSWLAEGSADSAEYVLEPAGQPACFAFKTAEGVPIWPTPQGAPKGVNVTPRSIIENAMRFRALARLPLEASARGLAARFVEPTKDDQSWRDYDGRIAKVEPMTAPGNGYVVELPARESSEPLEFLAVLEVTNRGAAPVHIVVVSLEEAGCRRNAILGYLDEDKTFLRPAEVTRVGVRLKRPQGWPLSRPMRDRYVVLALSAPVDVRRLTAWGHSPLRSDEAPLPWVLAGAFAAEPTRSGIDVDVARSDWGVAWVDLFVR